MSQSCSRIPDLIAQAKPSPFILYAVNKGTYLVCYKTYEARPNLYRSIFHDEKRVPTGLNCQSDERTSFGGEIIEFSPLLLGEKES